MNRTIKEATVGCYHYGSHDELRKHLHAFLMAYNPANSLKTLKGKSPYDFIKEVWQEEPERFITDSNHFNVGLNKRISERSHGVLVTGATGFVGTALVRALLDRYPQKRPIIAVSQQKSSLPICPSIKNLLCNIDETVDWTENLKSVSAIVHLAGKAHMAFAKEQQDNEIQKYTAATVNLFKQAALCKVKRFIYVSSSMVHGRQGLTYATPGTEKSPLAPADCYAKAKAETEEQLNKLASQLEIELTILRPVLMYGPGVKGNLLTLMTWLERKIPWPVASVNNYRSMLNVDNFVDVILRCIEAPCAAGETFIVADDGYLSTPDLFLHLGKALETNVWLLPCPPKILSAGGKLINRTKLASQLLDDLCFSNAKVKKILGWRPRHTLNQGLQQMVDSFKRNKKT